MSNRSIQDYQLKVLNNKSQYATTNIERCSVILDAYCELIDGSNREVMIVILTIFL